MLVHSHTPWFCTGLHTFNVGLHKFIWIMHELWVCTGLHAWVMGLYWFTCMSYRFVLVYVHVLWIWISPSNIILFQEVPATCALKDFSKLMMHLSVEVNIIIYISKSLSSLKCVKRTQHIALFFKIKILIMYLRLWS